MPALTAADKFARKQKLEEKREARRLTKEKKDKEKEEKQAANSNISKESVASSEGSTNKGECHIFKLSEDSQHHVFSFLAARDVGALTMTCRHFSKMLVEARVSFILSRLHQPDKRKSGAVGCVDMCSNQVDAR
jgi:sRNA-binding protein